MIDKGTLETQRYNYRKVGLVSTER